MLKLISTAITLAAIALCISFQARAQVAASQNAALEYYRSFLLLDYLPDGMKDTRDPDFSQLTDSNKRAIYSTRDDDLWILLNATRLSDCDWGDHCSNGPDTLLPQLSPHNRMALFLYYNAMLHIEDDETDEAVESIAAIIRMAHHLVISDDVFVTARYAVNELEYALMALQSIPAKEITDNHRRLLTGQMGLFAPDDPLEFEQCVYRELQCGSNWLRNKTAGMPAHELRVYFKSWIDTLMPSPPILWADWPNLANPEKLPADIDAFEAIEPLLRAAWNAPDAPEQLDELYGAVQRGEHGSVAKIWYSWSSSTYDLAIEESRVVDQIRALLSK